MDTTPTGLRHHSWSLPNVAAERQRWALLRNRFAVTASAEYENKILCECLPRRAAADRCFDFLSNQFNSK